MRLQTVDFPEAVPDRNRRKISNHFIEQSWSQLPPATPMRKGVFVSAPLAAVPLKIFNPLIRTISGSLDIIENVFFFVL